MEKLITINDIKGLIRRRLKLFLVLFFLVMIGALVVAVVLPPIFRSQAVILIEAQEIPDEYVKSTITSYAEQRLESLTREILRYRALSEIIEEFDLYPEHTQKGDLGEAVRKMKAAIEIEPISSKVAAKSYTVAFILSYEGEDPQKAYNVVDRLSNLYLMKESESREKQAAATTVFLETELANLKQQIEAHEQKISVFKQQYFDTLPGSVAVNLSNMQRLEAELDQVNSRIRSIEDRKIYLKGQLANIEPLRPIQTESGKFASNPQERLKTLRLEYIRARARLSERHPDLRNLTSEIEELEKQVGQTDETMAKIRQLNMLRTQLGELKAVKGERHPDVIDLSKHVNELGKEVDSLISADAVADMSKERPDNPAYINLMTQIASADLEINNLTLDIVRINESIKDFQRRIEMTPMVEREFNELTLDYQNAKARYNDISGKLLEARVSQKMDLQQYGERFSITDPAYVPTSPSKPNRLAIMLLGFVLAIGVGLGSAALKEALDHTIKNGKDIKVIEGIDLLTIMPYTPTPEERRLRWYKRLAVTAICLGCFGIALLMMDKMIVPLDDVLSLALERLAY